MSIIYLEINHTEPTKYMYCSSSMQYLLFNEVTETHHLSQYVIEYKMLLNIKCMV